MRSHLVPVSLVALAACSGGGPQTVSSNAAPGASASATTAGEHSFVSPTVAKTYVGVGGSQVFEYSTDSRDASSAPGVQYVGQQAQIFAGNASTVRNSGISIAYDPRDAIFTLTVSDPKSGAATATRFQDPASRTDFNAPGQNGLEPQWGTPRLTDSNIRYLQAGDGDPRSPYRSSGSGLVDPGDNDTPPNANPGSSYQATSLFYEVPGTRNKAGTTTKYVSFAGYVRNTFNAATLTDGGVNADQNVWHLERGAFAYGELTNTSAVPKTGTGTFDGGMLATMVMNPTLDNEYGAKLPSYFQWIEGTSHVVVDFGASTVQVGLNGTVFPGQVDRFTGPQSTSVPAGASFTAAGQARIDLAGAAGFVGSFGSAAFGSTTNGAPTNLNIAGSSLDGAFFGPKAEEVGGGFRIVGGTPDERIDIVGTFTGATGK